MTLIVYLNLNFKGELKMFKLTQSNLATIFAVRKEKDDNGFYGLSNMKADTEGLCIQTNTGGRDENN